MNPRTLHDSLAILQQQQQQQQQSSRPSAVACARSTDLEFLDIVITAAAAPAAPGLAARITAVAVPPPCPVTYAWWGNNLVRDTRMVDV